MPATDPDAPSTAGAGRIIQVTPATQQAAIDHAARVVAEGGVAAFPTETVYGLGARADGGDGLAKLQTLKGRDPSKPIALLLDDFALASRFAKPPSPLAQRLAAAFCPGPITLVLPGRKGQTVGVRIPDHELALALVSACGGALYATSANASGQPPARSAAEVADAFPDGVDLILDAGPALLGEASTVVSVDGGHYAILRQGALSAAHVAVAASAGMEEKP